MWTAQSVKIKQHKKRVNYSINKNTIERFKIVADKNMRKTPNIDENLIRRYVETRVYFLVNLQIQFYLLMEFLLNLIQIISKFHFVNHLNYYLILFQFYHLKSL